MKPPRIPTQNAGRVEIGCPAACHCEARSNLVASDASRPAARSLRQRSFLAMTFSQRTRREITLSRPGMLLLALFALFALFTMFHSGFAAADSTPHGQFAVWAIGLPNGYVIMEHQAQAVRVTADDVMRGMVDVQSGTRIVITTTEPSGIAVDFRSPGKLFRAVQIDGIGSGMQFGPAGGTIIESQATAGRRVVTVNYRFILAPDTNPGTYAWPLTLAVRAPALRDLASLTGAHNTVTNSARHPAHDRRDAILIGRGEL